METLLRDTSSKVQPPRDLLRARFLLNALEQSALPLLAILCTTFFWRESTGHEFAGGFGELRRTCGSGGGMEVGMMEGLREKSVSRRVDRQRKCARLWR